MTENLGKLYFLIDDTISELERIDSKLWGKSVGVQVNSNLLARLRLFRTGIRQEIESE